MLLILLDILATLCALDVSVLTDLRVRLRQRHCKIMLLCWPCGPVNKTKVA